MSTALFTGSSLPSPQFFFGPLTLCSRSCSCSSLVRHLERQLSASFHSSSVRSWRPLTVSCTLSFMFLKSFKLKDFSVEAAIKNPTYTAQLAPLPRPSRLHSVSIFLLEITSHIFLSSNLFTNPKFFSTSRKSKLIQSLPLQVQSLDHTRITKDLEEVRAVVLSLDNARESPGM